MAKITSKDLSEELKAAPEDFDFKAFAKKAIGVLADAEKSNLKAVEKISQLGKQLEVREKNGDGSVIVTIDDKTFKIIGNRFSFPKEEPLDAKGLSERPDLLSVMLSKGSGALVEIN